MPAARQARSRCSYWKFIACLHWAVSWWVDGKPAVYYYLGTDDTKHRQLESFTVILIPPVRGTVKRVFHKPHWEIFAMVSIQIWVTRFHVRCTGELEQGCLAALAGSPFFSTALENHAKFTACDKRCFFPPAVCGGWTPRWCLLLRSSRSPRQSPRAARHKVIQSSIDVKRARKPPGSQ